MKFHQAFFAIAGFFISTAIPALAYYVSPNGAYQADIEGKAGNQSVVVVNAITGKKLATRSLSLYEIDKSRKAEFAGVKFQWASNSQFFIFTAVHAGKRVAGVISGSEARPFGWITNLDASPNPKLVDLVIGSANDVICTTKEANGELSHSLWKVRTDGQLQAMASF